MHVVWKRPDGYHGAQPEDFSVLELGGHSRIWLHKKDNESFPFRISGGWQEDDSTKRLNALVNLINQPDQTWLEALQKFYNDSMSDNADKFIADLVQWVSDLRSHLKGDTWELDIMNQAISEIHRHLIDTKDAFLKGSS